MPDNHSAEPAIDEAALQAFGEGFRSLLRAADIAGSMARDSGYPEPLVTAIRSMYLMTLIELHVAGMKA